MSQEKVDKRKQSKGEALHFAHKKVVMLSWIIVLLVVVAVALSITFNKLGYGKGEYNGYLEGYSAASSKFDSNNSTTSETTTASESETTSAGEEESK